jgi:ligand-binding sensor domain-containing protein
MMKDKHNVIWIATAGNGLFKMEDSNGEIRLSNFMYGSGMLSNRLTSVWSDEFGQIWYGTENNGVGCIDKNGNHLRKINQKNGISSNAIRSLVADRKGNMWIGTAGSGLSVVSLKNSGKKPLILNYKDGLTSTNVYLLTFDKDGNLIIGTEKGLDYVYLNEQNKV